MRIGKYTGLLMALLLSAWLVAQELLNDDFLEYLGGYQQVDGEWVDPVEFAESLEQMAQLGQAVKDSASSTDTTQSSEEERNEQ